MPVSDAHLRSELERALGRTVQSLRRHPGAYASSHAIEELEVGFDAGEPLRVVFKDLTACALTPAARLAKPTSLLDPPRELAAYRDVLGPGGIDAPTCYAAVADPHADRYWLLLEAIEGSPLWQLGEPAVWEQAARWLADLHGRGLPARRSRLLRYDADYLRPWAQSAAAFTPGPALDELVACWEQVVERLADWPQTFVHGEFYPANILVQQTALGPRIRPIDWEMAGIGPGLLDIAALTSGRWTAAQRERLALAYYDALSPSRRPALDDFLDALKHCRLYVAVQWLGWSEHWSPPVGHAHDWLTDAVALADELQLR
jgi:hypothetical protein